MKKVVAILLSLCAAFSFSFSVFADGLDGLSVDYWIPDAIPLVNYGLGAFTPETGVWYYQNYGSYDWPISNTGIPANTITWNAGGSGNSRFIGSFVCLVGFIPTYYNGSTKVHGCMKSVRPSCDNSNISIFFNMLTQSKQYWAPTGGASSAGSYYGPGSADGCFVSQNNADIDFRLNDLTYTVNRNLWNVTGTSSTYQPDTYTVVAFYMFFDSDASASDIVSAINDANTDINQGLDDLQSAIDGWGSGSVNPGADSAISSADSALGDLSSSEDVYWEQISTQIDDLDFSITDISALSAGLTYISGIFMIVWNSDFRTPIVLSLMLGLVLLVIGRGVRFQAAARRSERRERNNHSGGDP